MNGVYHYHSTLRILNCLYVSSNEKNCTKNVRTYEKKTKSTIYLQPQAPLDSVTKQHQLTIISLAIANSRLKPMKQVKTISISSSRVFFNLCSETS